MNKAVDIALLRATKSWGRGRIYDSIVDTTGHTPLVRLSKIMAADKAKADILMKLEFFNPLSSVKDRIGVAMINALESRGQPTRALQPAHSENARNPDTWAPAGIS